MARNSNTCQKIVLEEAKGSKPATSIWDYYPLAKFIIPMTVDKSLLGFCFFFFFFLFHIFYCRKESSTQPIQGSDTFI